MIKVRGRNIYPTYVDAKVTISWTSSERYSYSAFPEASQSNSNRNQDALRPLCRLFVPVLCWPDRTARAIRVDKSRRRSSCLSFAQTVTAPAKSLVDCADADEAVAQAWKSFNGKKQARLHARGCR